MKEIKTAEDFFKNKYPNPSAHWDVIFNSSFMNELVGATLTHGEIRADMEEYAAIKVKQALGNQPKDNS